MNKTKVALFVSAMSLAVFAGRVGAENYSQNAQMATSVSASSASIFTGPGVLNGLDLSTGNGTDYAIAFDTTATTNVQIAALTTSDRLTPALMFSSNTVVNGTSLSGNSKDFGDKGVYVKHGLYIYKSATASGENNRVVARWRK